MTRLRSIDIAQIRTNLDTYDGELLAKTGSTLRGIACHAAGLNEEAVAHSLSRSVAGVVPISWGQGVIGGFCQTTESILNHIGCKSFVTGNSNVRGLAEAYGKGADVIFMADDEQFAALNSRTRQVVDNTAATGGGFAAGLSLMVGGLRERKVLVLGCGPVGCSAVSRLMNYGAAVTVYDIKPGRAQELVQALGRAAGGEITIENNLRKALSRHRLVVDATNAAEIIHASDISSETYIAAPGMPLGLSRNALKKISDRLLHDPLQIGVATMAVEVLKRAD
jgi:pyrrolysine biosynthesis protein PylD